MTDKEQIIVNDCKVEECVNFRDEVSIDSTVLKNACSIGLWQRHYKNLEESCKMSCKCDENPNCYFKQHARKKHECEQKEKELLSNEKIINKLMKEVDELRQECEELKEKLEKFYTLAGEPIEYFLDHYTNLCEDFLLDDRDEDDNTIPILEQIRDRLEDKDTLEEENTRYRKGFEEIEEIIKQTKQQVFCQHCAWYNTDGCDPSDKICGDFIKILDIIDKTKGEK